MHTALLATFLLLSTQPAPPPAQAPVVVVDDNPRWGERCPRDVVRSFIELERSLRDLGESVDAVDDRRRRRDLRDDLDRTIRLTERARDAACDAARQPTTVIVAPPPPVVVPPPPFQPVVLSPSAFNELKAAVDKEAFDDGKARVIGLGITGDTCVTVDQVRTLMKVHSFSDAQIGVVQRLAPRLVDPQRGFTLQEGLTFSTDKDRLAKTLKAARQLAVCKVPG